MAQPPASDRCRNRPCSSLGSTLNTNGAKNQQTVAGRFCPLLLFSSFGKADLVYTIETWISGPSTTYGLGGGVGRRRGVGKDLGVGVGLAVGVGVGETIGVGVGVDVGEAVAVGVAVTVGVGDG